MEMTYNEFREQQDWNVHCSRMELIKKIRACADTLERYAENPTKGFLLDDAFDAAETLSDASKQVYDEIEKHYEEWCRDEEENV